MSIFSKRFRRFSSRGFTLVELLVVSVIILVITAFILFSQEKFNSSTLLRSLGYNIALSVRQAQVYGTSVFGVQTPSGVVHAPAYGVSFSFSDPTHYVLFLALTNDYSYSNALTEKVKLFTIGSGYRVTKFCATAVTGLVEHCSTDATPLQYLTIYFKRPNPDAYFATDRAGEEYAGAYVQVRSGNGDTRSVSVTASGQIAVVPPNTTPPTPPPVSGTPPPPPGSVCGDGIVGGSEACDLGDSLHGDGNGACPKTCSLLCSANTCVTAPTCTISPSQTIVNGQSAAINYSVNGTALTQTINGASVSGSSGVYAPSPTVTTNYTMEVSNSGGSNTCGPITVTVNNPSPFIVVDCAAGGGTQSNDPSDSTHYRLCKYLTPGSSWTFPITNTPSGASVTYLVVGGGGGGGSGDNNNGGGGGGGAGGFRTGTLSVTPQTYPVTVGAGGSGTNGSGSIANGGKGGDSIFASITAAGGGGGSSNGGSSGNGGSGGGASRNWTPGTGNSPSTSPAQGTNGGNGGAGNGGNDGGGGGGGGASSAGSNGNGGSSSPTGSGGNGGAGTANSISGSSATYAGGGGGGGDGSSGGSGGSGGGGAGGGSGNGSPGTQNTGGGGGGGYSPSVSTGNGFGGGGGGSGIVIIRWQYQ